MGLKLKPYAVHTGSIRFTWEVGWAKRCQVDGDVFDVLMVGVAAALHLHSAVAAIKGVLAQGEEGGGARGEEFAIAGPERPISADK